MQLQTTGFMPGSGGVRLQTCVLVGMRVCFFSDISAHDCHCMCGCTLTTHMLSGLGCLQSSFITSA